MRRRIAEIISVTAGIYGVPIEEITGRGRQPESVRPRYVAMFVAYKTGDFSMAVIGRMFGRHHSSVVHAIDMIEARRVAEPGLDGVVARVQRAINGAEGK